MSACWSFLKCGLMFIVGSRGSLIAWYKGWANTLKWGIQYPANPRKEITSCLEVEGVKVEISSFLSRVIDSTVLRSNGQT